MNKPSRSEERKQKRQYWTVHIKQWQSSELSQQKYCDRHNLKSHRFTYWKKRILSSVFVSLPVPPAPPSASPITVATDNGYRIEIKTGFDPSTLVQVFQTLRSLS